MTGATCLVSVVIPAYNSANTLRRAVVSVLEQTLRDHEIIIVDDASQDATATVARDLALIDRRVHVLELSSNGGKSHAMNVAIRQARGEWVAVLDADDWYSSRRLQELAAAAARHGVALVADNQYFHDAGAGVLVRTAFPQARGEQRLTTQTFVDGSDPYGDFDYGMLKPMVRTDFIRQAGLAYRENARLSEDFLYLVEYFAGGGFGLLVPEPLYHWTQPFGSISRHWTTTGAGAWRYDYQAALAANSDVLHELRQQGHHELANLLVSRARAFRRLHHLSELRRMRASGSSVMRVIAAAAGHPSVWPLIGRRILR